MDLPNIDDYSHIQAAIISEQPVFVDNFDGSSINPRFWYHDEMVLDATHQVADTYTGDDQKGRRHAAFYNERQEQTGFIANSDYLVQRGIVDYSITDPLRNLPYADPPGSGEMVNFGDYRLYTSFLRTFGRKSDSDHTVRDDFVKFSPGHFFEIRVNFENMSSFGHRHSFWLMPARLNGSTVVQAPQLNYDNSAANGVEIDIYEHEFFNDPSRSDNFEIANSLLMKVLGDPVSVGGTGSTNNEINNSGNGIGYLSGSSTTVFLDNNSPTNRTSVGWHTVGLYWSSTKLVWYLDGEPVVLDNDLIPQTDMYMLLTREMNSGVNDDGNPNTPQPSTDPDPKAIPKDPGLFGQNVGFSASLAELGQVNSSGGESLGINGQDHVLVDYVKVWTVSENGSSGGNVPPNAPGSLTASRYSATAGEIFWPDANDSDGQVVRYEIRRDGVLLANEDRNSLFVDDLTSSSGYTFAVKSVDDDGAVSDTVEVYMPPHSSGSNSAPSPAPNFRSATYSATAIEVFWDTAYDPDGDYIEYELSRNGAVIYLGDGRSRFMDSLQPNTTYNFSLVTIDEQGARSAPTTLQASTN